MHHTMHGLPAPFKAHDVTYRAQPTLSVCVHQTVRCPKGSYQKTLIYWGFYIFKPVHSSRLSSTHRSTGRDLSHSTDIVCMFISNSEMSQSPLSQNPNSLGVLHFQAHAPFTAVQDTSKHTTSLIALNQHCLYVYIKQWDVPKPLSENPNSPVVVTLIHWGFYIFKPIHSSRLSSTHPSTGRDL